MPGSRSLPSTALIARVVLPFACGYFLSYLFRVVNAVIAPHLGRDLELAAGDLGLLTAVYFITFAAAQIPLGIALDRYGAKRTEAALLLVAVAGAVLFATAEGFTGLLIGRALIGLGVSACLMAAFKAFVVWFPPDRLPQVNGWQMAAGGMGAVAATTPVAAAVDVVGWRGLFVAIAVLTALTAALILIVVPDERRGRSAPHASLAEMARGTLGIFRSSLFWRVAPMTVSTQSAFMALQGLWLGPWLTHVVGLPPADVARHLLVVAVAMVAGFISLGWAGARAGARGHGPLTVTLVASLVFLAAQAAMLMGLTRLLMPLLALFGFFGTAGIVAYAGLTQRFPAVLAGRVNTAINLLVFVSAFAMQWGVGAIIGQWPVLADGRFAPEGYRVAFGLMLGAQVLCVLWYLGFRRRGVPAL